MSTRPGVRFRARAALLALAGALAAAGCASPEPEPPPREPPRPPARRPSTGHAILDREPVFAGRTLIYPVRNQRAEDVAAMLQSLYPYARIVPHLATNSLLIYVPPRREVEEFVRSGATGQTGQIGQPPVGQPQARQPQGRQPQGRQSSAQAPRTRTP